MIQQLIGKCAASISRIRASALFDLIKRWLQLLEVDRAVSVMALARGWQALAGPITVFLIAQFMSPVEQGFYYTFGSILMAQSFFELGLSFVLGVAASHEFVHLRWSTKGGVEGDQVALQRFSDLLTKSTAWYALASVLLVAVLIPFGFLFFARQEFGQATIHWRIPWVLVVIGSSLNLLLLPWFAVIEGSGQVAYVNAVRLVQSIFGNIGAWLTLGLGGGLLIAPVSMFGTVAVGLVWLVWQKPKTLWLAFGHRSHGPEHVNAPGLSWRHEIWPMQWRFAITVMSGFFIYQLLTPVLFYYQGPVVAGQMGMTIAMVNVLYFVATAWITARVPTFATLVSRKNWTELDSLFGRVVKVSFILMLIAALAGFLLVWGLQQYAPSIGDRFLPAFQVAILLVAAVADLATNAVASYLRAHRREPLMWLAVGGAVLKGLATWQLGMRFSSQGVVAGTLAINLLFILPLAILMWLRLRRKWHRVINDDAQHG